MSRPWPPPDYPYADAPVSRRVHLTQASTITMRAVHWLWHERLALGTLALMGGREGIGKSLCVYTIVASATTGGLPGDYANTPKSVIIVATEDSWEHTIVPRLTAAGADLTKVFRADVHTSDLGETLLSLPRDVQALEDAILEVGAAIVVLDPLMSRVAATLDTHKDQEVRQALEPLVALADRTKCVVLGLIHVNKTISTDALTTLMGSRAFAAVARAVLFVMTDPNDEHTRLLGQAKNNLGRMDLPTLAFTIAQVQVGDDFGTPIMTAKLEWAGDSTLSIREAMSQTAEHGRENAGAVHEATGWLEDYLATQDGHADSTLIKREGQKAGHSLSSLQRARLKLRLKTLESGFPRKTFWAT